MKLSEKQAMILIEYAESFWRDLVSHNQENLARKIIQTLDIIKNQQSNELKELDKGDN